MIKLKSILLILLLFVGFQSWAQILFNNGAQVWFNNEAEIQVNGSVMNEYGTITLTETSSSATEITITEDLTNNDEIVSTGNIRLYGDWTNNADFTSTNGTVFLEGTNQTLGGTVETQFYNLDLSGDGIKTLDFSQQINGILNIDDSFINLDEYNLTINNTNYLSVERNEGYIYTEDEGLLIRKMISENDYIFPLGSPSETERYRPVIIHPSSDDANSFGARFINNDPNSNGYYNSLLDSEIEGINDKFYHIIERQEGSDDVNLRFMFDEQDGDFNSISYWTTNPSPLWMPFLESYVEDDSDGKIATNEIIDDFSNTVFVLSHIINPVEPEEPEVTFTVYNSFSPNNDGVNDTWIIDDIENYTSCTVTIFNRNGNTIYESKSYIMPWDGTYKSKKVPDATYYYLIDLHGDGSELLKGNITIIR